MLMSTDRILVSHFGSLPRNERLADLLIRQEAGEPIDTAELAREAGITVRTLRYYRERKLLPPPRREGRIGWYAQAHLDRLRVIGQLVDRGHTLGGIAELLSAWEQGYDLADLLGFERAMTAPWSDEVSVPVTVAELSALLGGQLTDEVLQEAIRLGYLDVDGDRVRISGRLLDTVTVLVREGIPLPAILAAASSSARPSSMPRASTSRSGLAAKSPVIPKVSSPQ